MTFKYRKETEKLINLCRWYIAAWLEPLTAYAKVATSQRWGKMTTFDLWPIPGRGGEGRAWGAGTNMWHPETPASYESLPAPSGNRFPHFGYIHTYVHLGGGGALILDRCRAFDIFESVDAHLLQESWVQLQHPPTPTQWNLESEVRQIKQCRIYTVVHIKNPIRLYRKKTYELLKISLHIFALRYAISDEHFLHQKNLWSTPFKRK